METAELTKVVTDDSLVLHLDLVIGVLKEISELPTQIKLSSSYKRLILDVFELIGFELSDVFSPESFAMDRAPFEDTAFDFLDVLLKGTRTRK